MVFCAYKDIFGEPYKGVHSYRIPLIDVALVDVICTIIGAYLLSKLFNNIPFMHMLFFLFMLGIFLHKLFCVETKINNLLFN